MTIPRPLAPPLVDELALDGGLAGGRLTESDLRSAEAPAEHRWWRPWMRVVAVSLGSLLAGAIVFTLTLAVTLDDPATDSESGAFYGFLIINLVVGLAACIAIGPVRGSRAGNLWIVAIGMTSTLAFAAWLIAVMRLGARRSLPMDVSVVALVVGGGILWDWFESSITGRAPMDAPIFYIIVVALSTVIALLFGRSRGTRAALITSLRAQAASAERERAALAQSRASDLERARAEERAAIARDMHDSISHDLAVVATQAGALAYRSDLSPELVRETAATVRESAARANTRLREVLQGMREPNDSGRGDTPLPGLDALESLLANGTPTQSPPLVSWLSIGPGDLSRLSDERIRALCRTLSELLVNAGKHAPGADVRIELDGGERSMTVTVANALQRGDALALGTGYGLIGARERVHLVGGSLEAGARARGDFVVEVKLPW
ncbi:sensor histidine kinase [Pseudoclavibacter helvolus]|uniref:sensor histidine kinase n=1 Tax=Pseudoclavibacter helvolus TaxID=255205 RepID=UPI0024ACCDB2|nr:histidine kinase [Pseudoclavibacter helvolus]